MEQELTLFDKLYCCYYQAVRQVLEESACTPVSKKRMEEICEQRDRFKFCVNSKN